MIKWKFGVWLGVVWVKMAKIFSHVNDAMCTLVNSTRRLVFSPSPSLSLTYSCALMRKVGK